MMFPYTFVPTFVLVAGSGPLYLTPGHAVLLAIVCFMLGFAVGNMTANRMELTHNVRVKVAVFITAVWATSIISAIFVDGYTTSVFIHGIMGSVVGYLFGIENPLKKQ